LATNSEVSPCIAAHSPNATGTGLAGRIAPASNDACTVLTRWWKDALSFTRASLQPSGAAADRVMNRIRYSSGWSIPKWT